MVDTLPSDQENPRFATELRLNPPVAKGPFPVVALARGLPQLNCYVLYPYQPQLRTLSLACSSDAIAINNVGNVGKEIGPGMVWSSVC